MRYHRRTRILCVLFSTVLTALSVLFFLFSYTTGAIVCAIIPNIFVAYFMWITFSTYREAQALKNESEKRIAEADEVTQAALRSSATFRLLAEELRRGKKETHGQETTPRPRQETKKRGPGQNRYEN